jgi:hypothetical protein
MPEPTSAAAIAGSVGQGTESLLVDQLQEHIRVTGQTRTTEATEVEAPKLTPRFGQ